MNEELQNNNQEMNDAYRVAYLIAGYIGRKLTDAERDELDEWVTASDENMRLFAEMTDEKNIEKGLKERGLYDADKAVELLKAKISLRKKRPAKRIRLLAVGVAACVILLIGLFLVAPLFEKKKTTEPTANVKNDMLPGGDKAVLTLSNGKQIILDSTNGNILQEDHLNVINNKGLVSYEGQTKEVEYHTLSIPRGGQYQLALADGTKVWLNAESSIRFPTAFTGKERKVDITGEVYFEVAHDADKPFKVNKDGTEVTVLGTHFDVNAYDDEASVKITLLEGSVNVKRQTSIVKLKPGQQVVVTQNSVEVNHSPDLDEVMAWKNGEFEFKDEPIEAIMRQVSRWYDVSIQYEGKINYHFNASIPRNVPVSKVLHLLELTDQVHFVIQNKTIIVKP